MKRQFKLWLKRLDSFGLSLELLLSVFSTYAMPIFIGLVSLLAIFAWKTQFSPTESHQLEVSFVKGTNGVADPARALQQLQDQARRPFQDTQLSENPFWFTFKIPKEVEHNSLTVEFPSRHAVDIACWDASTQRQLGAGNRKSTSGEISMIKTGFSLALNPVLKDSQVICRTSAVGPARLSVLLWRTDDLQSSEHEFYRNSGLLDGGIIILAAFVFITALINRNHLYILFSAWLLINLRMGALSAGWDAQWLGHTIPHDWLTQIRSITLTLYYLLTLTLFTSLFKDELLLVGHKSFVRVAQWTCFPLLLFSIVLPYASFLPLIWLIAGVGIAMLAFLLLRILQKTRSRVAMWYSASIAITLIASLYEVLAAALGIKGLIGSVNSVTAALSSSLLAALAIAEQMRQEHEQRLEVQAELEQTFAVMPIGLFSLDQGGRFLSANPAMCGMVSPNVLSGAGSFWQQYFTEDAWTRLHQMVHNKQVEEIEVRGRSVLGFTGSKRFLVKATLAHDKIEGSLQDVTEKSRAAEDLNFLANHDSLTKVLNRRGIERAFTDAARKRTEGNLQLAIAYLDLDRFKLINDLFGHTTGDQVLQQVCARVSGLLTHDFQIGRVGGDEFVIVFSETSIVLASLMCRGIIDSIGTLQYLVGDNAFYVRGSIGLIEVTADTQFNDALSTADRACRQAKSGNHGGLVVYERGAPAFKQHEAELKLIALLATSSATDGLYLEMQPIMSLTAPHESLSFEVLLRMRDADGNLVRTDLLIAAGENSGRMGMIDRWVLSSTLAWLNKNYAQMKHMKFVCMNLSGASLNDEKFLQDVYSMLERNPHIAGQLCLEITESVALHDLENTRRFVDKVRGYGTKIALDDFGAGYTSFSYLKEFTADILKIDGSFIVNMNNHPANIAIVEAIVSLAKNLGMKVIAEWAEDNATVQTLVEIGVDYVQGFAVARPQHPDNLLTAKSSASFIKNDELAQYVALIGKSDLLQLQSNLFSDILVVNVH